MEVVPVDSPVDGWDAFRCRGSGSASPLDYRVLAAGTGPPVVVMHELGGAGEALMTFAGQLQAAGYRTWAPIFFEPAGRDIGPLRGVVRVCVRSEFRRLMLGRATPLTAWLAQLVDAVAGAADGRAAVIGMCMTGGLVFGVLAEPGVGAAVAAQPSAPMRPDLPVLGAPGAENLGLDGSALAAAQATDTPLLALRFAGDRISPAARMQAVKDAFGDEACQAVAHPSLTIEQCGRLRVVEAPGAGHATLTYDAGDVDGATVDQVVEFLDAHLAG